MYAVKGCIDYRLTDWTVLFCLYFNVYVSTIYDPLELYIHVIITCECRISSDVEVFIGQNF